MGEAVGFKGSNAIMYGFGDVRDLQVFRLRPKDVNGPQVISCWRLTPEELAEVARTGVVWLSVIQDGQPPVYVSGTALVTVDGKPSEAEPIIPHKHHGDRDGG